MNEIETKIAHYEAEQARHRKVGFRFGFIALGFLVLNMTSGLLFTWLASTGQESSLGIFQLSEVLQIGLAVFGIMGIVQRSKAVNARKMVQSLQLIMLQPKNQPSSAAEPSQPAAAPQSSSASRAAKAGKNKS